MLLSLKRRSFDPPPFPDETKLSGEIAEACTDQSIQHMSHYHQRLKTLCL
jgi:hypothetical protein